MGSKNGTWLGNDQVTTPVPVKDGDRLRLGTLAVLIVRAYSPSSSTATVGVCKALTGTLTRSKRPVGAHP